MAAYVVADAFSRGNAIMGAALPSLDNFAGLRVTGLDAYDVLALNYCAASGLPGTERSNLDQWLDKRDEWAARRRRELAA